MKWNGLTFGVEIECYAPVDATTMARMISNAGVPAHYVGGAIHRTERQWKVVHDGSLHSRPNAGMTGMEIVSPVLRGEEGIEQVMKVAAAIKAAGGMVNKSCGLHVHIGAAQASIAQVRNVAKMFLRHEHNFDAVCPPSRQNNNFARSNKAQAINACGGTMDGAFAALDRARSVSTIATVMNGGNNGAQHYGHYRYFRLNFQSMATHGTIEFRQQAGSVEGAKIAGWIKTVAMFTAQAFSVETVAPGGVPSFAEFTRKCDRATEAYLIDRASRLAAGLGRAITETN